MPSIHIGLPQLVGKLESYADTYRFVEVTPVDQPVPRGRKLRGWRRRVPPSFRFAVRLPAAVASFGEDAAAGLEVALETARDLEAAAIALCTPASFRPTRKNRERLSALRERLPPDGVVLAWEARGIWEPEEFVDTAYRSGFLPIFDAAQESLPPGPVAYTRLRAMGRNAALGPDRLRAVAEQLVDRREAYLVADRALAGRVRAALGSTIDDARPAPRAVPLVFKPRAALEADDEEQ
ncbi:MAG: DUF72 domain-containing protein [Myxococcota bacterium]